GGGVPAARARLRVRAPGLAALQPAGRAGLRAAHGVGPDRGAGGRPRRRAGRVRAAPPDPGAAVVAGGRGRGRGPVGPRRRPGGPAAPGRPPPPRARRGWREAVAAAGARWPLGELRSGHLVALALAGGAVVAGGRARPRPGPGAAAVRAGGALAAAATVAVAALAVPRPGRVEGEPLGPGAELWADGGAAVVLVDGRSRAGA